MSHTPRQPSQLRHDSSRALRSRLLGVACGVALAVTGLAPLTAHAGSGAMDAFKERHEATIKLVKTKASSQKLQSEVDELLDYEWLAQAALGGPQRYEGVCAAKCDEFEQKLTKLIRQNYLRLIKQGQDHPVSYVKELEGRNEVYKVTTEIKVKKHGREQTVTVEYVMHKRDGKFSVRDLITDGVSLAKTYRYEFNTMAKKGGIDEILASLDKKLAETK